MAYVSHAPLIHPPRFKCVSLLPPSLVLVISFHYGAMVLLSLIRLSSSTWLPLLYLVFVVRNLPSLGYIVYWLLLGLVTRLAVIVHTLAHHPGYTLRYRIAMFPLWSPSWLAYSHMILHSLVACVPNPMRVWVLSLHTGFPWGDSTVAICNVSVLLASIAPRVSFSAGPLPRGCTLWCLTTSFGSSRWLLYVSWYSICCMMVIVVGSSTLTTYLPIRYALLGDL